MSKKLIKPYAVQWNEEDMNSTLFFNPESIAPTGRYLIRGGICFPKITELGLVGHAVMCGRSLDDNKVYVFDEREFVVIDHIIENNVIEYHGVTPWFIDMWQTFYGDTFFYQQDFEVAKKYRMQILKSAMIEPKPRFIECKRKDDDQSMHTLFEKDMTGKLVYSGKSKVYREMREFGADPKKEYTALHALTCALNGLERYIN